ncbi:tigger transposable element-derived protein 6-like [Rhizophagus irregularis DAOM 181602=DAOM 197198]|nr:tigger transposable element-derived protein 6-like [Rhizophagus irregularis DAOM 181602=DAOM 197198]
MYSLVFACICQCSIMLDVMNLRTSIVFQILRFIFLLPNTTSFLQPLDQGIIYSLKAQYRKLLCQNRIQAYDFYEEGDPIPPPIDIFDSIYSHTFGTVHIW